MSVKSEKKRFAVICGVLGLSIVLLGLHGVNSVKKPAAVPLDPPMETAADKGAPGKPLPEITFFDEDGDSVQLEDFRGKVILVNLWATWCAPCVAELPALEKLQDKMKDKNFDIVAISVDRDDIGKVKQFLADRKIENITTYWDRDRMIPAKWSYAGIPISYLIDEDGVVIERFNGPREWASPEMVRKISNIFK